MDGLKRLITLTVEHHGESTDLVAAGLPDILAAMHRHHSEPLVQAKALKLFVNLSYHSAEVADHMIEAGVGGSGLIGPHTRARVYNH